MNATPSVDVRDNPDNRTYEARVGDRVAGALVYEIEGPRTVLTHAWVEPGLRDEGVGHALAQGALDDLRSKGRSITVFCTFVAEFISEHPEYADLIDKEHPGTPRHV